MKQLKLFDTPGSYRVRRSPKLELDAAGLKRWQHQIHAYQQRIQQTPQAPQQGSLFDTPETTWHDPDDINPFSLNQHSSLFWRQGGRAGGWSGSEAGCLYFILDRQWPLLLYVGETKLSADQRWRGTHDCKAYIVRYIELHRRHDLPVEVVSAFWPHVPADKKILQAWEKQLILKWRSPFNKECWQWWGQPFGKT